MSEYLTEGALFKCNLFQGTGSIRCMDLGNTKVRYGGNALLTTGATVKSTVGICNPLTVAASGVPQNCICALAGWQSTSKNTSSGKPLLLQSSSNTCSVGGGFITSVSAGHTHLAKDAGSAALTVTAAVTLALPPTDVGKAPGMAVEMRNTKNVQKETASSSTAMNAEIPKVQTVKVNESVFRANATQLLCAFDKETCRNCEYPKTKSIVNNDAGILRTNLLASLPSEKARYYQETIRWGYAAHHILSGKQVFEKCTELARLMNYYDKQSPVQNAQENSPSWINSADNGIFLPTYNRKGESTFSILVPFVGKEITLTRTEKKESFTKAMNLTERINLAHEAMRITGLQWHLSHHGHPFPKEMEDELRSTYLRAKGKPLRGPIKSYATLLMDELDKLQYRLYDRKQFERPCFREKSPERFRASLKKIADKIRCHLEAFADDPMDSYPYYVSIRAFAYAFNLPLDEYTEDVEESRLWEKAKKAWEQNTFKIEMEGKS